MAAFSKTVRTRCGVVSLSRQITAFLLSGLTDRQPGNFERWPSGSLYVSNGLNKIHKWNGYRNSFTPVGLTAPSGTPVLAGVSSGSITGTYQIYVRFVDEDQQYSPLSTASAAVVVTNSGQFNYSSLPTPTDPRVVKRQILRNTDGQYTTFYVDVETTDLWSTSGISSTKDDATLATGTAVALFDLEGASLTSIWTAPRSDKPILAHHRNRLFAAGETAYNQGNARVTFGSATVAGTNTAWTAQMEEREFLVLGTQSPVLYTIRSVNTSGQTLTLSEVYRGATDLFASYAIRPPRAQRNTFYYSMAGEPEQWPPQNALTLEEAGTEITALIPAASFLYLAFADALYRFSFDSDPSRDGSGYRIATRGCTNQRTWARVNETFYLLDRQGIYRLSGGDTEELALSIRDLFDREAAGEFKIDWTHSQFFHAVLDFEETTVRFYVSLSGPSLPRHALCFNYLLSQWWIEEFPFPVTASTYHTRRGRLFVSGPGLKLYEHGAGTADGFNPTGYLTHGKVTSAKLTSLTDSSLSLPSSGVAGSPLVITAGKGKGQLRLIESLSGTTLTVTQPWTSQPNTTSQYQVGGIPWRIRTGWYQYQVPSERQPAEVYFEPVTYGTMDLRIYQDHGKSPLKWSQDRSLVSTDSDGASYSKDDPDLVVDLTRSVGYVRAFLDAPTDYLQRRGDCVALEARGVGGPEGVFLYSVSIGGAV